MTRSISTKRPSNDKRSKPPKRRVFVEDRSLVTAQDNSADYQITKQGLEAFQPRTPKQGLYVHSMDVHSLTFGLGPAGTGKTRCAAHQAAKAITEGLVDRIVCTRPAVEAEEQLGFMPGDLKEKYADWLAPFKIELCKELGQSEVELLEKRKKFVGSPLGRMRGLTFERSFVVLDEAQNTTPNQMKLFLTRMGEDTIAVVDGDLEQTDIRGPNGLAEAVRKLQGCPSVGFVTFDVTDIVRSGLVQEIVKRYVRVA